MTVTLQLSHVLSCTLTVLIGSAEFKKNYLSLALAAS